MQINELYSIQNSSDYFQTSIFYNGEIMLYNSASYVFLKDKKHTLKKIPIKKSCEFLLINKTVFISDEDGNVFSLNIGTLEYSLIGNFGIDCELYSVYNDKLLIVSIHNSFYKKAYIIDDNEIFEMKCEPTNCFDIIGVKNKVFFLASNTYLSPKNELCIFSKTENASLFKCSTTSYALSLTNMSIDYYHSKIAYGSGKTIKICDFYGNNVRKIKLRKRFIDFNWFDNGELFIVTHYGFISIYDGKSNKLLITYSAFNKNELFRVKTDYCSKYICVLKNDKTLLLEVAGQGSIPCF